MALFPGQHKDEQVILFLRRYWFILVRHLVLFAFLAVLPLVVQALLVRFTSDTFPADGSLGATLISLTAYVYWLSVALFAFASWIDYYLDYWVVTDRRIVSVEQKGLLSRTIAQVYLERVQDATAQIEGLSETFLHFGDAFVQSAGEQRRFVFSQVPNPNVVVATVMAQHRKIALPTEPRAPAGL